MSAVEDSFLYRTEQLWKIYLMGVLGALFIAWNAGIVMFAPGRFLREWSMVVAPAACLWCWCSLTCPECGGRLTRHIVSKFDLSTLPMELIGMSSCPYCGHVPPPREGVPPRLR